MLLPRKLNGNGGVSFFPRAKRGVNGFFPALVFRTLVPLAAYINFLAARVACLPALFSCFAIILPKTASFLLG